MLNSNTSLIIAIKPKTKENIYMASMLLFYSLQKESALIQISYFSDTYSHASF
jgi:hypothetical protein